MFLVNLNMLLLIRLFLHRMRLFIWGISPKVTSLDFYGESIRSISGRWETELGPVTTYHALFDVLRQNNFSGNFVELGGGYSTVLATTIFDTRRVRITSIDAFPEKYYRILNSRKNTRLFLRSIDAINEITVSLDEVRKALPVIVDRIIEYDTDDVERSLKSFVLDEAILERLVFFLKAGDVNSISNVYLEHHAFEADVGFYEHFDALLGDWACKRIADSKIAIDALFLDCGEASSLAEFLALEGNLRLGSYILLHDIYYPKSIKNFFLATLLTLDPNWEILYRDGVSTQGGLVARKVC